jgi:hypothetical protein
MKNLFEIEFAMVKKCTACDHLNVFDDFYMETVEKNREELSKPKRLFLHILDEYRSCQRSG